MEKEAWDQLQEDLEDAREAMHKAKGDAKGEARETFKDLQKQVADARSEWRAHEEAEGRRFGPETPEGVASAATAIAQGEVS